MKWWAAMWGAADALLLLTVIGWAAAALALFGIDRNVATVIAVFLVAWAHGAIVLYVVNRETTEASEARTRPERLRREAP
jgi:uncharacterized membrane protein YsdA (DUF1294 family)